MLSTGKSTTILSPEKILSNFSLSRSIDVEYAVAKETDDGTETSMVFEECSEGLITTITISPFSE